MQSDQGERHDRRRAMMRNGIVYRQASLAHHIAAIDCLFLPTPTAQLAIIDKFSIDSLIRRGEKHQWGNLAEWLAQKTWLQAMPQHARRDDGVSYRLDRIKGLGNAAVPPVIEFIGQQIMQEFSRKYFYGATMNQTVSPITEIWRRFPDAVFVTPKMIADVYDVSESEIRYHCRRLFRHSGHYRFWLDEEPNKRYLTTENLERLLRYIGQFKKS